MSDKSLQELETIWREHKKTCWSCDPPPRTPPPCKEGLEILRPLIDAQRERPAVRPYLEEWTYACPHCKNMVRRTNSNLYKWDSYCFLEILSAAESIWLNHIDQDCTSCAKPIRLLAPWTDQ